MLASFLDRIKALAIPFGISDDLDQKLAILEITRASFGNHCVALPEVNCGGFDFLAHFRLRGNRPLALIPNALPNRMQEGSTKNHHRFSIGSATPEKPSIGGAENRASISAAANSAPGAARNLQ